MFGHQEHIEHWSTHLIKLRELQKETGGITEFIPSLCQHGITHV